MSQGLSQTEALNGISVLIPVFNRDVVPLIHQIKEALSFSSVSEIRVYDDASTDQMLALANGQQLSGLQGLVYKSLAQNLGRSKIRNLLAKEATYEFLVFIDCDSALPDLQWAKRYWDQRAYPVQYGGTAYENSPVDKKYSLHHRIGNARETRLASERSSQPYRFFTWNNVAIHKKILEDHPIPEVIQGYGHEDTLFSSLLEKAKIPIKHIDNPVVHLGLETNQRFLEKGAQAIQNLVLLADKGYPQHQHRLYQSWRSFLLPILKWVPTVLLLWKLKCTQWILLGPLANPKWYDIFKLIHLELANRNLQKRN